MIDMTKILIALVIIGVVILIIVLLGKKKIETPGEVAQGTKILVCDLNDKSQGDLDRDAKIYSAIYRSVNVVRTGKPYELLNAISENSYDIVHLFCEIDKEGNLIGEHDARLQGGSLLETCRKANVKLLVMANNNGSDNYIKAFTGSRKPQGLRLNLVMTLDRKGDKFPTFLEGLLQRMSKGMTMPEAWVELAPQIPGKPQGNVPDTIFSADRGEVKLLP